MKTLQALTLLGCLTFPPLFAVEPTTAALPLFQAIREGDAAKVDVLLKNGAAVSARDGYGNSCASRSHLQRKSVNNQHLPLTPIPVRTAKVADE